MKAPLIYAAMFLGSLLVALEVVLLIVPHDSERTADPGVATVKEEKPAKDSLVAHIDSIGATHESVTVQPGDTAKAGGVASKEMHDSTDYLKAQLDLERKKVAALSDRAKVDTTAKSTERTKDMKTVAKLLDAMDAQGAARILQNMDDKQVKEVLLAVKKRQAGKILGSFDPERAARIMR
jgi:flagellar motility protein MotE (MotC chaperone)